MSNRKKLFITNCVVNEKDHDEYFQLRISHQCTRAMLSKLRPIKLEVSGIVTSIVIYRDRLLWSNPNNHWEVEADVAILLQFEHSQVLFKAIDSLAGFIAIYNDKTSIQQEIENIQSTWQYFKTDKVDQCERKCLSLG